MDCREVRVIIRSPLFMPKTDQDGLYKGKMKLVRWDGDILLACDNKKSQPLVGRIPSHAAQIVRSVLDAGIQVDFYGLRFSKEEDSVYFNLRWCPSENDKIEDLHRQLHSSKVRTAILKDRENEALNGRIDEAELPTLETISAAYAKKAKPNPTSFTAGGVVVSIPSDVAKYTGPASGRLTAFKRGARAAHRGTDRGLCPYKTGRGSSPFRDSWLRGYDGWMIAAAKLKQPA